MHASSKPVFVSDNGKTFDSIEDAAKESVRYAICRILGETEADYYSSLVAQLADSWFPLHTELLRINKERCEIADAEGV